MAGWFGSWSLFDFGRATGSGPSTDGFLTSNEAERSGLRCGSAWRSCAPRSQFSQQRSPGSLTSTARPVRLVASIEIVAGPSVWGGCWERLRLIAIAFASTVDDEKHCEVYCLSASRQFHKRCRASSPQFFFSRRLIATSRNRTYFPDIGVWCNWAGIDAGLEPSAMTDIFSIGSPSDFRVLAEEYLSLEPRDSARRGQFGRKMARE